MSYPRRSFSQLGRREQDQDRSRTPELSRRRSFQGRVDSYRPTYGRQDEGRSSGQSYRQHSKELQGPRPGPSSLVERRNPGPDSENRSPQSHHARNGGQSSSQNSSHELSETSSPPSSPSTASDATPPSEERKELGPDPMTLAARMMERAQEMESGDDLLRRRRVRDWVAAGTVQVGQVVFLPSDYQVRSNSMVRQHADFVESCPWSHPVLVVDIRPGNAGRILTCLKLTSKQTTERWNASINSVMRALLYVPIEWATAEKAEAWRAKFRTPLLRHDVDQGRLREASFVNTERAFDIEEANIRTFLIPHHEDELGYSISVASLRNLAAYISSTPILRIDRSQLHGVSRGPWARRQLTSRGVACFIDFVKTLTSNQNMTERVFQRYIENEGANWGDMFAIKW